MKITLEIDTASITSMTHHFLDALARAAAVVPADPQPAAAPKTRTTKSDKPGTDAPASSSPAPSTSAPEASPTSVATEAASSTSPASSPTSSETTSVAEADLIAAANAAAATLGASGPAKLKAHIAGKFTKIDGTPGTLKSTRPEQQAALLADLQKIARKELAL